MNARSALCIGGKSANPVDKSLVEPGLKQTNAETCSVAPGRAGLEAGPRWRHREFNGELSNRGLNVPVKPDKQDFDAVEKENGPLAPTASEAARAERYRLAQVNKIIRQLEQVALAVNARKMRKKRKPQK